MNENIQSFNYDLSICMIVKNEEKYIESCLKALQPLRDSIKSELIITDTGSTDRTIEIITKYADRVINFEWCNDFSKARNTGLEVCSGKWLLYIDADEIFDNSITNIIDFMNSKGRDTYNAAGIVQRNYTNETKTTIANDLFTNRMINLTQGKRFFENTIHEFIPCVLNSVYNTNAVVDHYGYVDTVVESKIERNRQSVLNEYEKNPNDLRNIIIVVNQSQDKEENIKLLERAISLDISTTTNQFVLRPIYTQLFMLYFELDKIQDFIDLIPRYFEVDKDNTAPKLEIYYWCYIFYNNNKYDKSLNDQDKAIFYMRKFVKLFEDLQKKPDLEHIGVMTYKLRAVEHYNEVCYNLAYKFNKSKNKKNALKYYQKCDPKKDIKNITYSLQYLSLGGKLNQYRSLFDFYTYKNDVISEEISQQYRVTLNKVYEESTQKDKLEFLKIFSKKYDEFTALNYIRLNNYNLKTCNKDDISIILVDENIEKVLCESIIYYDLLYACFKSNLDLFGFVDKYSVSAMNAFISNIYINHESFIEELENILDNRSHDDFKNNTFFNNIFYAQASYIYITENIDYLNGLQLFDNKITRFKKMFNYFVENTYFSLEKINSKQVDNKYFEEVMPYQEFCKSLYENLNGKDARPYLEILQEALNYCPEFLNICNIIADIYNAENSNTQPINQNQNKNAIEELEVLLNKLKETIYTCIENKDFKSANLILHEYKSVNPTDPEIEVISKKLGLM